MTMKPGTSLQSLDIDSLDRQYRILMWLYGIENLFACSKAPTKKVKLRQLGSLV
jgi:hypothetical protein